jgi:hypothetical protein
MSDMHNKGSTEVPASRLFCFVSKNRIACEWYSLDIIVTIDNMVLLEMSLHPS